jgi:DNA replication and repair protein RecF
MLSLKTLSLVQFRNYIQKQFEFNARIVGIVGANGTGKTNILDAIYYLSFTKSYFNRPDGQNVHHGFQGMRVEGLFDMIGNEIQVTCILRETGKKEFYFDDVLYPKLSQHIGKIPTVMIAPDDVQIITGLSEERRKLMDSLLSQIDANYLRLLIQYNKVLQQRNSLLKWSAEQGNLDETLLGTLNQQLVQYGQPIFEIRTKLLNEWLPLIQQLYITIAGNADAIHIQYQSNLHNNQFADLLHQALSKDKAMQRTSVGIHKDDLIITIQAQSFKQEASQGQRKSLLFAIRLAEWELLKKVKGFCPILLMDDIFEKLDEVRMAHLLGWVAKATDGPVFITDTHKARVADLLGRYVENYQLIEL